MTHLRLVRVSVATAALVACAGNQTAATRPSVVYVLVPFACSSVIPVQFYIDSILVGTDTFRVNVAGGDHTASRQFAASVGEHTLGAQVVNGYVWPNKVIALDAGAVVTDSLPFYCS